MMNKSNRDKIGIYDIVCDFIKNEIDGTEWQNKVFLVGGCVRDEIMNKEPKDIDLMIDKENGGVEFAVWLTKRLNIYKENINPVIYKRFGTAKFNLRKIFYNGINLSDIEIESVMPRTEKYSDNSRKPDVIYSNLKKDADRRDITINTLFKNISNGEILDLTGMGVEDIKNGIIRTPSDPDILFSEDPLRMLRAIRFTVKYNWILPIFMIRSIKKNANKIQYISSERIQNEFNKMLLTDNPDKAIRLTQITGLSKYIFPELDKLIKLSQNKYHKYDVMKHTLQVLRSTPPNLIVRLSALFHDIGKSKTKEIIDNEIHFYEHEVIGSHIARDIMKRLHYPKEIIKDVTISILEHMRLKSYGDEVKISDKSLRKLERDLGQNLQHVLDLIHADNISHADFANMPNQIPIIRKRFGELEQKYIKKPKIIPINGTNIIDILGLEKGGPIVGKILKVLEDIYLEEPFINNEEIIKIIKKTYDEFK